jgi:hypothetical protein
MLGAARVLGSLKPWPIGIKVSGLADDESSGAKVFESLMAEETGDDPASALKDAAAYKAAPLPIRVTPPLSKRRCSFREGIGKTGVPAGS